MGAPKPWGGFRAEAILSMILATREQGNCIIDTNRVQVFRFRTCETL